MLMQSVTSSLSETAADKRAASPLGWGLCRPAWSSGVPYLESGIESVSASVLLAVEGAG